MSDVFREVDEALKEDRARQLWRRYGTLLISGAVAIVLVTAGWVFWQRYQANRDAERTNALFASMAAAEESPETAMDALAAVAEDSGGSHAMLARLYEAELRSKSGDTETALLLYGEVAGDSGVAELWRQLATLLAVQLQVDTGEPAALEAELAPLLDDASPWRYSARELAGLLALRREDKDRAIELFGQLADDPTAPGSVRGRAGEILAWLEE